MNENRENCLLFCLEKKLVGENKEEMILKERPGFKSH